MGLYSGNPAFVYGSVVRKGINEWRANKQPVNLSLSNRLDFAGWPVPAELPESIIEEVQRGI